MHLRVDGRSIRYAVFALLAVTINVVDGALARSISDPQKRLFVAAGATLDIVVVVAALYYWLLVRPGIRTPQSLIPLALAGALHATFLFPNGRGVTAAAAGLCEAGLIAYVAVHLRKARSSRGRQGEPDPVDALRDALHAVMPAPLARVLAAELSIFYYALFSWRARPHAGSDAQAFTLHQKDGRADLLYALGAASVLEILPVHLLLHRGHPGWAWAAAGLSLYGLFWLIGLARSLALRPVLVGPDSVDLRYGLIFRLKIPRESIALVRCFDAADAGSATMVPRRCAPTVLIDLARVLEAEGLMGIRKPVRRVALAPDESAEFEQALRRLMSPASGGR